KPFPIKQVEMNFTGGTGIVMDDVVAGVICNAILRLFIILAGLF
ncbi:MAG: phosphatidylglycerophosphatase A, partial [Deltaproteobacteria bacterium]|nr:phosphatidylglycerophosphatase A [Deltaproteobacteria bacterium]